MTRGHLVALVALAIATVGWIGAADARVFMAILAGSAVLLFALAMRRWPAAAAYVGFVLLLLAGTKFRVRDADASLTGVVDAQVIYELALFALLGLTAVMMLSRSLPKLRRYAPSGAEWMLVAFVAVAVLSTAWSFAPRFTLVRSVQLAITLAFVFAALATTGFLHTVRAATVALVAYVAICAATAVAVPSTAMFHDQGMFRFTWFAVHPIVAGSLAGMGAVLAFGHVAMGSRPPGSPLRHRGVAIAVGVLLLLVLVATNSRGPLFACVAGLSALFALRLLRLDHASMLCAALLLGGATVAVTGVSPEDVVDDVMLRENPVLQRILRGQTTEQFRGLSGRVTLWEQSVPLVEERPLIGHGFQASRAALLALRPWAGHAHNALLQTLLDLGVLGALLLWIPLVRGLGSVLGWRADAVDETRGVRAMIGAVLVFLLVNSVSGDSFAGSPSFETALAFMAAMHAARERVIGGVHAGVPLRSAVT